MYMLFYASEAPVAQWVNRWPADLAVLGSSPAWGGDLFNRKRVSIAHSLPLYFTDRPHDLKTVEKDVKSQVIHPFTENLTLRIQVVVSVLL